MNTLKTFHVRARLEQTIVISSLLLMVVVTLQPLLNLLALSLSDPARTAGFSGLEIMPKGLSFDVWAVLLKNPQVQKGIVNSAIITVVGTIVGVAGTTLMAWSLSRPRLPGRRLILIFVLVTMIFDAGIIPDYFLMRSLGLLNSYWSVILYKAVNAWYLIILVRFFEEFPNELVEAAEMDGAGAFRVLWTMVIPLSRSALATIALFYFVFHWNEFFRPLVYLTDQDKMPLQVVLRQFVIEGDKVAMVGLEDATDYSGAGQISAKALQSCMVIMTIVPILAIYPLILRFFTKGVMSGAVKG